MSAPRELNEEVLTKALEQFAGCSHADVLSAGVCIAVTTAKTLGMNKLELQRILVETWDRITRTRQ